MAGPLKTVAIDGMGAGAFCIGENDPNLSNDTITLLANGVEYPAGTVLAKFTSGGNNGKFTALTPGASDGSQIADCLLWDRAPISGADTKRVVVSRHQKVNGNGITYVNAVTDPQKAAAEAALAAKLIMVRR